jgi:hypothetical protein
LDLVRRMLPSTRRSGFWGVQFSSKLYHIVRRRMYQYLKLARSKYKSIMRKSTSQTDSPHQTGGDVYPGIPAIRAKTNGAGD